MQTFRKLRTGVAAVAAVLAAGCSDTLSLEGTGEVQVLMQRAAGAPIFPAAPDSAQSLRSVAPDTVASLTVDVTSIEFLRVGGDSGQPNGWMSLSFGTSIRLDLMALPSEGASPLVVAEGRLAAGTYGQVRLFVRNPRIQFRGDVGFGAGNTLQGGVEYDVTIPSGDQTGLKTDVSFTVEASSSGGTAADVGLLFDAGTTLGNVTLTGDGRVMLSPVLRAR